RAQRLTEVRQLEVDEGPAPRLLPPGLVRATPGRQRPPLRAVGPQVAWPLHRPTAPRRDGEAQFRLDVDHDIDHDESERLTSFNVRCARQAQSPRATDGESVSGRADTSR